MVPTFTSSGTMSLSYVCENCGHRHGWTGTSHIVWWDEFGDPGARLWPSDADMKAMFKARAWELGETQRRLARAPLVVLTPARAIRHRDMKPENVMRPRRSKRGRVAWRSRPGMARIVRMQRESEVV